VSLNDYDENENGGPFSQWSVKYDLAPNKVINDFSFIIGSARYECPWFLADFLSPKVGKLHSLDSYISELVIETEGAEPHFADFMSGCLSGHLVFGDSEQSIFALLARELGNFELYSSILSGGANAEMLSNLSSMDVRGSEVEIRSMEDIESFACHFHELPTWILDTISVDALAEILSHPKLQIKDEDSVLDYLSSHWNSNRAYFPLVEFVYFEFLSPGKVQEFVDASFGFFGDMNVGIWRSVASRLIHTVGVRKNPRCVNSGQIVIPFVPESNRGIIAYLKAQAGESIHEKNIVTVSARTFHTNFPPENLIKDNHQFYNSLSATPDQWVCFDFQERRIIPTHYVVTTYHWADFNPQSWVIETSMDGTTWKEVDRKIHASDLRVERAVRAFPPAGHNECRFIRFRQTENNPADTSTLCLTRFDVFGTLFESS
jgi:hypothetical protein